MEGGLLLSPYFPYSPPQCPHKRCYPYVRPAWLLNTPASLTTIPRIEHKSLRLTRFCDSHIMEDSADIGPPLRSSGQSSWLQNVSSEVRTEFIYVM
jgi:hypothetical protein